MPLQKRKKNKPHQKQYSTICTRTKAKGQLDRWGGGGDGRTRARLGFPAFPKGQWDSCPPPQIVTSATAAPSLSRSLRSHHLRQERPSGAASTCLANDVYRRRRRREVFGRERPPLSPSPQAATFAMVFRWKRRAKYPWLLLANRQELPYTSQEMKSKMP